MLKNLFSIFDPSCSSLNMAWMTLIIPSMMVMVLSFSKTSMLKKMVSLFISKEFAQNANSINPINLKFFLVVFNIIMLYNLLGLTALSFTVTAQIALSFPLALIIMLSIWSYNWSFKPKHTLAHFCPKGAPLALAPILTLIEVISMIIRPITLSIRLSANMMAGHLLLSLLFGAISLANSPIMIILSIPLFLLEVAVSIIQAYVFSMLITLYKSE